MVVAKVLKDRQDATLAGIYINKTACLLLIKISLACARASKLITTNINIIFNSRKSSARCSTDWCFHNFLLPQSLRLD